MNIDLALLIIRVAVGLFIAVHGAQKLFGAFGGYGLKGTTGWIASLGLKPAPLWTLAAALGEFGGGLLLALGLLTPLGAIAVAATMVMAIALAHWPKVFATDGGYEYPLIVAATATALAIAGPGAYSLDGALGLRVPAALSGVVAVLAALSVLGGPHDAQSAGCRHPGRRLIPGGPEADVAGPLIT
ncbi:DoxX family protein [Deinococcus peraridilitoris]|uniref:Putative membrane protein n=1 Tax=Deinococcus peraridilitoris (strain DSM 19664 / LMG 22246 / CIP 109416 / KR-200) TaxID=937777 RepID=L0A2U0_DEIPD|nr:DoxX family protein [Deinococcus peraridilitoris]AFZ67330.1 putative membrane protein [Deinococcus peraridilitoris DSM 19664]